MALISKGRVLISSSNISQTIADPSYKPRNLLLTLIILYFLSIFSSMAGMSFFSSVIFVYVAVNWLLSKRSGGRRDRCFAPFKLGTEFFLGLLVFAVGVGAILSAGFHIYALKIIGRIHWIPWLYVLTFALNAIWEKLSKLYWILPVILLIAIYAITQHFTGIDLIRSSHRAVQPMGGYWRSAGFFSSPMTYGYLMGAVNCFLLSAFLGPKPSLSTRVALVKEHQWARPRWFYGGLFLLVGVSLFTTLTRGVWVASLVAYGAMLLLVSRKVFFGFLGATLLAVVAISQSALHYGRLRSILSFQGASYWDRMQIWTANFEMLKDHFFFGVGYGENERLLPEYYAHLGVDNGFLGHAHNSFIQFLAGTGAIGTIGFLGFILSSLFFSYQLYIKTAANRVGERVLLLAILGSQIFMIVGALTEATFQDSETTHAYVFIYALLFCIKQRRPKSAGVAKDSPNL